MEIEKNKPMYTIIADDLRDKIKNKVFSSGDKLPGEFELADQYGVSRITSKKALDVLESEGIIHRIKGSGSYVSSQIDINNRKNSIEMIAMILPFSQIQGGAMDMLHGLESVANDKGFYVSLHNSGALCRNERKIILDLVRDGVKGIIYYPAFTAENFDLLKLLTMNKYPIVMIDKYINDIPIDSVVSDNFQGSYKMTRFLIDNGHRAIAFASLQAIHECSSIKDRFLGYCKAMEEANIPIDINRIWYDINYEISKLDNESNESIDMYQLLLKNLLNTNNFSISAIQAVGDELAISLMNAAKKIGINIPDDISLVGFDDLDAASMVTPQLTTVRQNFFEMGATAARLVIDRIANPQKAVEQIKLPTELVVRKSVLPCRKNKEEK